MILLDVAEAGFKDAQYKFSSAYAKNKSLENPGRKKEAKIKKRKPLCQWRMVKWERNSFKEKSEWLIVLGWKKWECCTKVRRFLILSVKVVSSISKCAQNLVLDIIYLEMNSSRRLN